MESARGAMSQEGGIPMPSCNEMKKGDVYVCGECGLELKVVKECKDAKEDADACSCCGEEDICCDITCCGEPLARKD
jgi:hypothetical protein